MRDLQFTVDEQTLSASGDILNIVRGSKGYLRCRFAFCQDSWKRCNVVVVFESESNTEYAVPLNRDGVCDVPDEVTDGKHFKIRLIGVRGDYRITTNKILINQGG